MKKTFSILLTLALVLSFSVVATTPVAAATLTVNTSIPVSATNFHTIQAAINAANPGDTIQVAAGTYIENATAWCDINLDEDVSLIGAGSGSTIVELTQGKTEGLQITGGNPNDITIEGMAFTRQSGKTDAADRALRVFVNLNSLTLRDVIIEYAKVNNVEINGDINVLTIQDCNFHHAGSNGLICPGDILAGTITNTHFDNNGRLDVWASGMHLFGQTSNLLVTGCSMNNNTDAGFNGRQLSDVTFRNVTASNNSHANGGYGIAISEKTSSSSNITLENITAENNGRDGILVWTWFSYCSISDVTITGGLFTNNGWAGIRVLNWPASGKTGGTIDNVTVTCAQIENNYRGVWFDLDYSSSDATTSHVNYNSIEGNTNYGVYNSQPGTLDAENNWWGDTDGSGPYDPNDESYENPGGEVPPCSASMAQMINADGVGDKVRGRVDYCPWLGYSAATTTGAGNASFTCSHGCINNLTAVSPTPPNQPVYLPYGVFSFNISCVDPGQQVTVTVKLPGPVPVGSVWWKYQGGSWYSLPIGDDDGDDTITVTLTDGGQGDADLTANGEIIDDGGPGPLCRGLIVRSTEGGKVTKPGEGHYVYEHGTVVKLVATPDDGYKFVEWTHDVRRIEDVNAAETTITMDRSYVIIANFVTVETSTVETSVQYELNVSSTMGGSVANPGEGTFPYIEGTVVSLLASPDDGYEFINWTGDGITKVDSTTTSITMNGDHSVKASFEFKQTTDIDSGGGSSIPVGACFIATAAYGTSTAEQIGVLREFRDVVLLENSVGSEFVALYYQLSPPVADFIAGNSFLRAMVRELVVDPVVWVVEATGAIWRN